MYTRHNEKLLAARKKNAALVATHRGAMGGSVIQNTTLAYKTALMGGADCIEMDVVESTDGVFFAVHNGEEKHLLHMDKDIRTCSSAEIETYHCYNSLQNRMVHQKLERVADVLPRFRNTCFINIDRSWFYWPDAITLLSGFHMEDQIILKAPPEDKYLDILEQSGSDIMFMPIIRNVDEWEKTERRNINVVAAEFVFDDLSNPVVSPAFIDSLHAKHVLTWVNALTLWDDKSISGFLDDNLSISEGPDAGWGKLRAMGFDILQTDWPGLLYAYLKTKKV